MISDDSRIWIYTGVLLLFLLIRGFFTACEYALTEVRDGKVKALSAEDDRYARLRKLLESPHKLMLSFSMQRTLTGVVVVMTALLLFSCTAGNWLARQMQDTLGGLLARIGMLFLLVLVTTGCLVILTGLLPKRLAERHVDSLALRCTGVAEALVRLSAPFTAVTYGVASGICRLFGVSLSAGREIVTEEEIRLMVDAGNETGTIAESEREMINSIFDFDDKPVSEVMTHRTDLTAVERQSKIADIVYLAINEGKSRIPVFEQTVDNIVGIIYVKDLLCLVGCEHSEDFTLEEFLRTTIYVPEAAKCRDVFRRMTREKQQMAVVVDEYGGTAGIVTMEDLLEEIVGDIEDEYDHETAELVQLAEGVYSIDGAADPEDILPKLGADAPEQDCYDTMSALVVDLLGRIPAADESPSVVYQNLRFTVLLTEDNWISRLKAERLTDAPVEQGA